MPDVIDWPDMIEHHGGWWPLLHYRDLHRSPLIFRRQEDCLAYIEWRDSRQKPRLWDHVVRIWRTSLAAGMWGTQGPPWKQWGLPWR